MKETWYNERADEKTARLSLSLGCDVVTLFLTLYQCGLRRGGDLRNCSSAVTPLLHEIQRLTLRILFSTDWGDTAFAEAKVLFPKGKWEGEKNNKLLWWNAVNIRACGNLAEQRYVGYQWLMLRLDIMVEVIWMSRGSYSLSNSLVG